MVHKAKNAASVTSRWIEDHAELVAADTRDSSMQFGGVQIKSMLAQ